MVPICIMGNYAAMYHAGHKEYKLKLLELINYHNNEDHRLTYRQMYESVVNPSILQKESTGFLIALNVVNNSLTSRFSPKIEHLPIHIFIIRSIIFI